MNESVAIIAPYMTATIVRDACSQCAHERPRYTPLAFLSRAPVNMWKCPSHLKTFGRGRARRHVHVFWCSRQVTIRFMIFFRLIRDLIIFVLRLVFSFFYSQSSQYVANREKNVLIVLEI